MELFLSSSMAFRTTSLPLFSYKWHSIERPKNYVKPHFFISSGVLESSSFMGESLIWKTSNVAVDSLRRKHVPIEPIRAVVKRRKEIPLDNVIQKDKKLKLVLKLRKILVSQPDRVMSLRELGKYRRELGIDKKRRFIALLKKFPAVFEIIEEGVFSLKFKLAEEAERLYLEELKFKLAEEAERLYLEELKIRNEMEDLLVVKLRKLLMMSLDKRILMEKIAHLKTDLGLPLEFSDTICHRYPQYFRVVATERGPALELTHWDPELALSAAELAEEENEARELEERNLIIDRLPKFNKVKLPKGLNLSKGEMRKIGQFREIPYISPYSDFSELRAGTMEKEKHACGVVHEILSLTVEKRTLVDKFTHFREEFRFSQQLRGMLIRHPDMFYVSLKGDRDSVFLREAYRDSQLIEKDRLLLIKERLRSLVAVPRYPRRRILRTDSATGEITNELGDGSGKEENWSDDSNFVSDEHDDDDDYDDDWGDEGDEAPPNFDDGESVEVGLNRPTEKLKYEQEELVPVLPDGRPRERW